MNCPKCNHDVELHEIGGCYHGEPLDKDSINYCDCELTHAKALRAAQRHAAAVRLTELRRARDVHRFANTRTDTRIANDFCYAIKAYMWAISDLGVQRPRTVKE